METLLRNNINQGIKRNVEYDCLKGILILLVILGHSFSFTTDCWHNIIFNAIYSFHMPLFVMISGYFFYSSLNRPFSSVIKKRFYRLIIPCFIWSLFLLLIHVFRGDVLFRYNITSLKLVYNTLTSYWYLICVFALSIFYYPIGNFLNYHDNKYLKVSLVLVIVWILSVVFYNYIPSFCLKNCQIQRQFIPFGVGLLFNKYEGKASINKISICGALSLFVSFIINKKFGVWIDNYSEVLRIIDGCLMAIFCFSIFKLLSVIIRKISFVNGILCYFGKNTLEFYLLHMFIAALFPWKSFMVLGNENFISIVVFLLLTCITSLLLAILRFAKVAKFLFVE